MPRTQGVLLVSLGLLFAAPAPGHADDLAAIPSGDNCWVSDAPAERDGHSDGPGPTEDSAPGVVPLSTGAFSSSLFRFVTTIPDDGQGQGGGYQVASARLNFVDVRPFVPQTWSCLVQVGMPLRTEHDGTISSEYAAQITADVATAAAPLAMQRQSQWMPVAFCKKFGDEMRRLFREHYQTVGGRVEKSQ